jgi:nucleoside-diphosphate-sugar epimerase
MKSVLVTGATGFIGSRLVSALVEKKYSVSTLVREGKHTEIKTDEIIGDLTDPNLNFEGKDFDCVFHLASHTPLEKNSKVLENVNLNGTKNLFEAINGKTKSIIYVLNLARAIQIPSLSKSDWRLKNILKKNARITELIFL